MSSIAGVAGIGAAGASQTTEAPDTEFAQAEVVPLLEEDFGDGTNVEPDTDNYDSAGSDYSIASGLGNATPSFASSVFNFTYANGRRYHSDRFTKASYFMPNDEKEQERLDLYHHIFLLLLGGKLHTAPLENPRKVLDVGTGTGLWAMDFADEYPGAEVIGTDISPIQPSWVPPNVSFEVEDMEETWTYPDNFFDFVHLRSMCGSFQDWDKVLKQSYEKLRPGAYIEFQDYGCQIYLHDGTHLEGIHDKYPMATYFHYTVGAAEKQGRPLLIAPTMKARMEKAGFVDCVAQRAIWPVGPWPKDKQLKEIGKWALIGALDSLFPFGVHLLTREGWTAEQVKELCDMTAKGFYKTNYYTCGWFVYGRKPEGPEI